MHSNATSFDSQQITLIWVFENQGDTKFHFYPVPGAGPTVKVFASNVGQGVQPSDASSGCWPLAGKTLG